LREVCGEAYYLPSCLDKEETAMKDAVENRISHEELAILAIKLRNDLFNYEDKLGSCRDFADLTKSAGALVVAILEPVEYRLSIDPPKKAVQVYEFPRPKGSIPNSLH
jgi:hypothetical protein